MPWNGTMLGYSYEKGKYIVVPDEAALVKLIYEYYLDGLGYNAVAKRLSAEGYKTSNGKPWYHSTIMKILRNYTYTGNLLLQKTYRENHITKKTLVNRGELPMYHDFSGIQDTDCQQGDYFYGRYQGPDNTRD